MNKKVRSKITFECLINVTFTENFKHETFSVKKESLKLLKLIEWHTRFFGKYETFHMLTSLEFILENAIAGFKHDFDFLPEWYIKSKKTNKILVTFLINNP